MTLTNEWTPYEIASLFTTSGWPPRSAPVYYKLVADRLNAGQIAVTRERIVAPPPLPANASWLERAELVRARDHGGEWHSTAKYWAWHWLRDQGEPEPCYEWNGIDVWAPVLRIQVECGDTDPLNVIRALDSGCSAFVLLPRGWRSLTETDLYVFRPTGRYLHARPTGSSARYLAI